jgi:hypothetical protein
MILTGKPEELGEKRVLISFVHNIDYTMWTVLYVKLGLRME